MVLLKTHLRAEAPGSIPGHVLVCLGQSGWGLEQSGPSGKLERRVSRALPTQTILFCDSIIHTFVILLFML